MKDSTDSVGEVPGSWRVLVGINLLGVADAGRLRMDTVGLGVVSCADLGFLVGSAGSSGSSSSTSESGGSGKLKSGCCTPVA